MFDQDGGTRKPQGAVKDDDGKLPYHLLPPWPIEQIVAVLAFGAEKYAEHNWISGGGLNLSRLVAATERHLAAWKQGEETDSDSGLSHLAHALCNLVFLMETQRRFDNDDIYWRNHPVEGQ
jgi:hypothetical protein